MKQLSLSIFQNTETLSLLLLSLFVVMIVNLIVHFLPLCRESEDRIIPPVLSYAKASRNFHIWSKKDVMACTVITALYALFSLWQLGSLKFPETTWQPAGDQQEITFALPAETKFSAVYAIYGEGDNNANPDTYQLGDEGIAFYGSNDQQTWIQIGVLPKGSIYQYSIISGTWDYQYVKLASNSKNNTLTEIGLLNEDHTGFIPIKVISDSADNDKYPASLLIDEQDKLVVSPTYYDQGYFDEVYHPRNAWEIANGQRMYATVHPLLGTNIMALFIRVFGMKPFVWRLPGALAGIAIVPLVYAIALLLFNHTMPAIAAAILCAGDFMHLTTSRIGTLEPFSVLLILAMFYWMIKYFYTSFYDHDFRKTLFYLLMSGIFMGLAISAKWTACYSAVGLAVLLFTNLGRRYYEYHVSKKILKEKADQVSALERDEAYRIANCFAKKFWTTIAWCFVFFIFIPVVIYWLSYLPDKVWGSEGWSIANVWKQNLYMYNYHTNLKATHPYQSTWYQWLLDIRPIWYAWSIDNEGLCHSISCFSNPLLTWVGLPAIFYVLWCALYKRKRAAWVIVTGYLTALLPWVLLVDRCVFAYHFYPTSFFVIFAVVYLMRDLSQTKIGKILCIAYLIAYVVLFLAFLPVTAGFGAHQDTIRALEWFETWYFG